MENVTKVYEELANSLGQISECLVDLVDKNFIDTLEGQRLFEAIYTFDECKTTLERHFIYAKNRSELLATLMINSLDVERANQITLKLNRRTDDVIEVKKFLDVDFLTHVLDKYQRMIIKEYIQEYELKINLIYDMFIAYRRDNKINNLDLPKKF